MPNFEVGTINASAPQRGAVGATSEPILPANNDRMGLIVVNLSTSTVYIAFGSAAVLQNGIALAGGGGTFSMDEYTFSNQQVNAIANSGTLYVGIQEFIR